MGTEDVIRTAFIEARKYMNQWDDYKKRAAAGDKTAIPPRKDLTLEPLAEVLRGERLTFVHGYRADEMLMMMRMADEFGFKINSFEHGLEGYKIAKEIAAHGAVGSTFSDWWAYKVEAYDAIPYNAAIMTRKGVLVALNSDSAERARHLNQEAASAMKYGGLNEQEALALITINSGQGTQDRRPGRFDRSGQGCGSGDLEPPSAEHLRRARRRPSSTARSISTFRRTRRCASAMEEERKSLEALDKKNAPQGRPAGDPGRALPDDKLPRQND